MAANAALLLAGAVWKGNIAADNVIIAGELLRTGRLGKVHTVRAHIAPWDAAEMRHDWLPAEPLPPVCFGLLAQIKMVEDDPDDLIHDLLQALG